MKPAQELSCISHDRTSNNNTKAEQKIEKYDTHPCLSPKTNIKYSSSHPPCHPPVVLNKLHNDRNITGTNEAI